jgi:pyrimidine operon attenuation protein/uracil phosphoribosyltransferase
MIVSCPLSRYGTIFFAILRKGWHMEKALIMDKDAMNRALTRIAHEMIEKNKGVEDVALIGIQRRGVPLAKRIAQKIEEIENVKVPLGVLDITFYRDDLSLLAAHPVINGTDIGFQIEGKKIVLVDDVIYTGRTVRAAIECLFDLGRPQMVQLAVLIDRGHRELPFRPDYVGKNIPTSKSEVVSVQVVEIDSIDKVTINEG